MMKIIPPKLSVREVYAACISHVGNSAARGVLDVLVDDLVEVGNEYEALGRKQSLNALPRKILASRDSQQRLRQLYDYPFSKGPERRFYDRILSSAPRGRCPQCGVGLASTLDHFLPRNEYVEIAILPMNLVPVCKDCNYNKKSYSPKSPDECLNHPYFDDWSHFQFVEAEILKTPRPRFVFKISNRSGAPSYLLTRVQRQFELLKLAELYTMNAGSRLAEIKLNCLRLEASGQKAISQFFGNWAESLLAEEPNGWVGPMYRCLADSTWFCGGGYKLA